MKNPVIKHLLLIPAICGLALTAQGASRTWNGSVNNDFNNSGNYSGSGALLNGDDIIINLVATKTITLSSSITINSLTFTITNGAATAELNLGSGGYTLTVNNNATFDASAGDVLNIHVMGSPSSLVVKGVAQIHNTGGGITYAKANASSPGSITLMGNATMGANLQTQFTFEPNWVFDANGSQTITFNNVSNVMGESITFGNTNNPSIIFTGSGDALFYSYDGNITVNGTTSVSLDACRLDRYSATGGTFTMAAGSRVDVGGSNAFPGFCFYSQYSTYSINATSTISYYGTATTQNISICASKFDYGYLIIAGTGTKQQGTASAITVQNNMTVNSGSTYSALSQNLTVNGNMLNNGTFQSTAGTCTFKGNFTNNGTFTYSASGTCIFNGSAAQNIGGTTSTTFYNLTINNSSGTGQGVTQNINTKVDNKLTLTNGVYNLNSYTLELTEVSPQGNLSVSAGSASSYIVSENTSMNSLVKWDIGNTFGSNYIIPFGYNGYYLPFTFNPNNPGGSANFILSVATYHTANTNSPLPPGVTGINGAAGNGAGCSAGSVGGTSLMVDRFWQINTAGTTVPAADVTFTYWGAENTTSASCGTNLSAQRWDAVGGWWGDASTAGNVYGSSAGVTSSTSTGSVAVTGITKFSPWALVSQTNPLPVEFINLASVCQNNGVQINWTTASETNNNFFSVQRSSGESAFIDLATVQGAGTSSLQHRYNYTDPNPQSDYAYYRIKQTDFNGKESYSSIIGNNYCHGHTSIQAYAISGILDLTVYSETLQETELSVYDVVGQKIVSEKIILNEGSNIFHYTIPEASGLYLIQLAGANRKMIYKKIAMSK